jgi:hypothetical protein
LEIINREILEIREIGKFHKLDSEGYILNSAIYPIVQKEYEGPIRLAIEGLLEKYSKNIHSIYLRGSIAKGIAVHGVSDIDFILLVQSAFTEEDNLFLYKILDKQIGESFSFVNGMEFQGLPEATLIRTSIQFMFRTQCVCIYGEDIIPDLPKFKIDRNAIAHSRSLKKDIQDTLDGYHSCGWIMKRIVRVGLEICMIEEQVYTRDLYPCYQVFSKHYPDWAGKMRKALELAIQPSKVMQEVKSILTSLGYFLVREVERKNLNEF